MTDHDLATRLSRSLPGPSARAWRSTLGWLIALGWAGFAPLQAQAQPVAQAEAPAPVSSLAATVLQPEDLKRHPAHWRFGVERVKLPGQQRFGLAGASYLVEVAHGFSVGPALYGSVTGGQGGFAVMGVEGAWRRSLFGPLGIELGYFVGGGGGPGMPVGGGLMLRPHADLLWNFGGAQLGLSVSQVRFPNGRIDSTQAGLVIVADTDFRFLDGSKLGVSRGTSPSGRTGVGFDRVQAVVGLMRPRGGSSRLGGAKLRDNIGLVGLRLEQALDDNAYWGLEANAAARGGIGGYQEYLASLGWERGFGGGRYSLGARAAVGMGGGGTVDVGGGLLLKVAGYATVRVAREFGLSVEGGMTRAPKSGFSAPYVSASLNWILDDPSDVTAPLKVTRTEWSAGVERLRVERRDGTRPTISTAVLKVNRYVSPSLYVTAQGHSAIDGGNGGTGGFRSGLLGAGARWALGPRVHVGGEIVAGAAGGGNVDNRGGAIVQPSLFAGYDITPSLALRGSVGRVKSIKGALDSTSVDAALVYTFGVPGHGYR